MSGIAGLLLIIYGAVAGYVGWTELRTIHPTLTPTATYATLGIGVALVIAGLSHFKAPHKAFLISVPLLLYFHFQCYTDATLKFGDPMWLYQGCLAVVSAIIILLSYMGYRSQQAAKSS